VKRFADLTEQEILALAISNEEEDSRNLIAARRGIAREFLASAEVFDEMAEEEVRHRTMLFDLYRSKFGDYLPLIRRQDSASRRIPWKAGATEAASPTRTYSTCLWWQTRLQQRRPAWHRASISPARPGCTYCSTICAARFLLLGACARGENFLLSLWARLSCRDLGFGKARPGSGAPRRRASSPRRGD